MTIRALLDANVIYQAPLRDTLLHAAEAGCFQPAWSSEIIEEAIRNLRDDGRIAGETGAQHLRDELLKAFPEAVIEGHEALGATLRNHPKDRHVAAAALHGGCSVLVTHNVKHFQLLPATLAIEAPDAFLVRLWQADSPAMIEALERHSSALRRPPLGVADSCAAFSDCTRFRFTREGIGLVGLKSLSVLRND